METHQPEEHPHIHIGKEAINALPLWAYDGPVAVVRTPAEMSAALANMRCEPVLGFDTETRPAFRKGVSYSPALLQLATSRAVYILQLKLIGDLSGLEALLSDAAALKVGVSLAYDVRKLQEVLPFMPAGFVEVEGLAKSLHIQNAGLRGLAALLMGVRISKASRTSNWEVPVLTQAQVVYAATDAWVSRELYLKLVEMGGTIPPAPPRPEPEL